MQFACVMVREIALIEDVTLLWVYLGGRGGGRGGYQGYYDTGPPDEVVGKCLLFNFVKLQSFYVSFL